MAIKRTAEQSGDRTNGHLWYKILSDFKVELV